jgi:hypothetical protein
MLAKRSAEGTRNSGERNTLNAEGFPNAVFPWYRSDPAIPPAERRRHRAIVNFVDPRSRIMARDALVAQFMITVNTESVDAPLPARRATEAY